MAIFAKKQQWEYHQPEEEESLWTERVSLGKASLLLRRRVSGRWPKILEIVMRVLSRWLMAKQGEDSCGRASERERVDKPLYAKYFILFFLKFKFEQIKKRFYLNANGH